MARKTLTDADASIVKAMLLRGDRQHDIAALFGVNAGRVADVATGKTFRDVFVCQGELPPSGPYDVQALIELQKGIQRRDRVIADEILAACADVEKLLPGNDRMLIEPAFRRLLNCAGWLEVPM